MDKNLNLRDRRRANRAAAKLRRQGVATMAGHCLAAGLTITDARSMASSMRKHAEKNAVDGVKGTSYAGKAKARECTRYTAEAAALACATYKPRKAAFKAARAALLAR